MIVDQFRRFEQNVGFLSDKDDIFMICAGLLQVTGLSLIVTVLQMMTKRKEISYIVSLSFSLALHFQLSVSMVELLPLNFDMVIDLLRCHLFNTSVKN